MPKNNKDGLRRNLDCAVINTLHGMLEASGKDSFDTVKGIFTEGDEIYPGAGFREKTHIQICVRDHACIKGIFRVPNAHLASA